MNIKEYHDFASLRRKFNRHTCIAFFPNSQQFRKSALPQEFPFTMPMMNYIRDILSSPKTYQKLIKCCKLFFIKNSILIIEELYCNYFSEWVAKNANECACGSSCKYKFKKLDLNKTKNKIWVSKKFDMHTRGKCADILSTIIPQIYKCDAEYVKLVNQIILYDDLKVLAAGVKECYFASSIIVDKNSVEVPLENIIQIFSGAKKITIIFLNRSHNATCKNYDDFILACSSIKEVLLDRIPHIFDVPTFYQKLKHTKNRSIFMIFSYFNANQLRGVVDEILATESFDFVPPVINFVGQNEIKHKKLTEIQANEAAKLC